MDRDRLNQFLDHIRNDKNDRSAVLIAAVFLENLLEIVIASFLVKESPKEVRRLLRPFSAKINMAYALGLISDNEFYWLKAIKDIRNDCAHKLGVVDGLNANLAQPPFLGKLKELLPSEWINKLSKPDKDRFHEARNNIFEPHNARQLFNYAVVFCSLSLYIRSVVIENGTPQRRQTPPMVNQ